jgi:molybdopterin converting factor small subunit
LALGRTRPAVAAKLHDTIFNFAVNDEMLLHDVNQHPIKDGDVVEIVPAISGGCLRDQFVFDSRSADAT